MSTKGNLITKVAGDLSRSNLNTEIGEAIDKAIAFLQPQRLRINVGRGNTFATVAGQYRYTSAHLVGPPALSDFYEFDAVWVEDSGGQRYRVDVEDYPVIEAATETASASSGRPYRYARYSDAGVEELWLFPIPDAVYTMRVAGHYRLAGPASDGEVNNRWMIDPIAYEYLRYATQEDIYANKIRNTDMALKAGTLKGQWLYKLREVQSKKRSTGKIRSSEYVG